MTTEEQAKEAAHSHITERCKSTKCEETNCHPNDKQVSSYHTRCRVRYQEYRNGYIKALSDHEKEIEQLKDKAVELFSHFVMDYAHEAGYKQIHDGAEHYIQVFTEQLNKE